MAGDGPLKNHLKEIVNSYNAKDKVKFIGAYNKDSLKKIFDENSVFILISKNEGWSIATAEAASLGRPLILSCQVGAHFDLLKNGRNGFIVPPDDIDSLMEKMKKILFITGKEAIEMQKKSRKLFLRYNNSENFISDIQRYINKYYYNLFHSN